MNIPFSRVAALAAAAAAVFVIALLAQPSVLRVSRAGKVGGHLTTAQKMLADPATLGSWVPWLGLSTVSSASSAPSESAAVKTGPGATFTWGDGLVRVEEATALRTRVRVELSGAKAEKHWLTLVLDDQGGGLTGTLEYESDPGGLSQKLRGLFSDPEERVARRLDSALAALAAAVDDEEKAARKREEELRAMAEARVQAAAKAAQAARSKAEFEGSLPSTGLVDATAKEERRPPRLRPSQMRDDETTPLSSRDSNRPRL